MELHTLAHQLQFLGYNNLRLTSDPEGAIESLKGASVWDSFEDMLSYVFPVSSLHSNGLAERTNTKLQSNSRTMRSAFESRIKVRVMCAWDIVPWLARHRKQAQRRPCRRDVSLEDKMQAFQRGVL